MATHTNGNTEMSNARDAYPFDPELHPWERQPGETDDAYAMYVTYRDMTTRNMALFDRDPSFAARGWTAYAARNLWSRWSWGWRNAQFDRYMANRDVENLVRYRRLMKYRHRKVAAAGFAKMSQWVKDLDAKTLSNSEAIRLFEVFVRIEVEAAGDYQVDQTASEQENAPQPTTLKDLIPGIDPTVEADLAKVLDALMHPDEREKP
jgi:hypothetical protein